MDRVLLASIVSFACAVALASLQQVPWPAIALSGLVTVLLLLLGRLRRTGAYIAASVVVFFFGLGLARVAFTPSIPEAFLPRFDAKVELVGVVRGDPDIRETTQRVTVEVAQGEDRMRILAVLPLHPELRHGAVVEVSGKLTRPEPFATDGGRIFRYDRFLAKDGIFGMVEFATVEVLAEPAGFDRILGTLYAVKHQFVRGLAAGIPEPHAALAAGLITGGKQGLGRELLDAFTAAGLVHIVVLSGYNVMIVAEGVLKGLAFLPRRIAASLAAGTIALFVLAAGAGTASVRAGLMAGLGLFARASGRTYNALRALLFVFFVLLLVNPLLLVYDPGFQFSFAATLGLILGAPILENRLAFIRSTFLRDITATTIAAQLFVLPLLLYQTGNLSLVSFPANIIALPAVPLAMLFSATAGFAGMVVPALAPVLSLPALAFLAYLVWLAETAAALPLATVSLPAFSFLFVPVLYLLLGLLLLRLRR
ncbi:MAG TPA: ComEC/Rec2 family competence protein [Candidatus Paceibacterota bacterium]|nr:ComEC/Rec2 family competence protein [Candidatus Paceibacterota bacterium]